MRVFLLAAGLLLCADSPLLAVTLDLSPPPKVLPPPKASPAIPTAPEVAPSPKTLPKTEAAIPSPKLLPGIEAAAPSPPKTEAKVACPCDGPKEKQKDAHAQTKATARRYAPDIPYQYAAAAPFHATWPASPQPAAPQPTAYEQGLTIDNGGWSGGVGYAPEGGGGGGFADGYGQVHFPTDAGNGPTYNSYNQSFQFNPSQPGPFQPRLMGGFAPPSNTGGR